MRECYSRNVCSLLALYLSCSQEALPSIRSCNSGSSTSPKHFSWLTLQVANVVRSCAHLPPGKLVADLGSGDGRLVIALAKSGLKATGYELNPWLVWYSRSPFFL
jgi:hypothetical protein